MILMFERPQRLLPLVSNPAGCPMWIYASWPVLFGKQSAVTHHSVVREVSQTKTAGKNEVGSAGASLRLLLGSRTRMKFSALHHGSRRGTMDHPCSNFNIALLQDPQCCMGSSVATEAVSTGINVGTCFRSKIASTHRCTNICTSVWLRHFRSGRAWTTAA